MCTVPQLLQSNCAAKISTVNAAISVSVMTLPRVVQMRITSKALCAGLARAMVQSSIPSISIRITLPRKIQHSHHQAAAPRSAPWACDFSAYVVSIMHWLLVRDQSCPQEAHHMQRRAEHCSYWSAEAWHGELQALSFFNKNVFWAGAALPELPCRNHATHRPLSKHFQLTRSRP